MRVEVVRHLMGAADHARALSLEQLRQRRIAGHRPAGELRADRGGCLLY